MQDESAARRHKIYNTISRRIHNPRKSDHAVLLHVANEFHSLGFLIKENIVDERLVVKMYDRAISRTWDAMLPWIIQQRTDREDPFYAEYFEYLYDRAQILHGDRRRK